jgi:hypothetical protein
VSLLIHLKALRSNVSSMQARRGITLDGAVAYLSAKLQDAKG